MPWRSVAGEGLVEERRWEYRRRQPEGTVLYEAVRDNLATLLADVFACVRSGGVRAILEHLGLPMASARLAPARGPPQAAWC
ncbi:hypothetical protein [Archangium violaceum]|uniref:hypothetical protein n=1 Tax=Archangium violaceum TaxID=83451 RepID=UPI0036D777B0